MQVLLIRSLHIHTSLVHTSLVHTPKLGCGYVSVDTQAHVGVLVVDAMLGKDTDVWIRVGYMNCGWVIF